MLGRLSSRFTRQIIGKDLIRSSTDTYSQLCASFSTGTGSTGKPSTYRLPPGQKVPFQRDSRLPKPDDPPILMPEDIEEWIKNIDTTLTPELQEKVARLKRQIIPANGPRTLARNVPTKDEFSRIEYTDGITPLIPPNAEALIDYALSFIPERTGPKRTREKKRMQHRLNQRVSDHKRRIEQTKAARRVKEAKKAKQIALMSEFKVQAGLPAHQPRPKKSSSRQSASTSA